MTPYVVHLAVLDHPRKPRRRASAGDGVAGGPTEADTAGSLGRPALWTFRGLADVTIKLALRPVECQSGATGLHRSEGPLPTYQYSCTACGHGFEIVQSFTDDALTVCPECSGRLRKVFNAVGVVFKGSGFYRTDSRKAAEPTADSKSDGAKSDGTTSDGAKSASTSGSTNGDSSTSGSTTSDAKPAAKAPAASNV